MAIFLHFSPTSSHLYSLQVENCASNSRLVVDEDDLVNSGLKRLNQHNSALGMLRVINADNTRPLTSWLRSQAADGHHQNQWRQNHVQSGEHRSQ